MELGAEAATLEKAKDCFIGVFNGGLFAIGDWFSMDGVAVIIVEDKDVVVATGGWNYKTAGLVGADLASDGLAVGVNAMGAVINGLQRGYSGRVPAKDISIGWRIRGVVAWCLGLEGTTVEWWLEQLGGAKV